MENKIDKLLLEMADLKQKVEAKKTPKWERIFWAIEKMLVPLAIAAVAFYGNSVVTKISEGQLALARANVDDRKEEFRRTMQSKYVELFYADIASDDQKRQSNALGLLNLMDPSLAVDLSQLVASSPTVSQSLKAEAETKRRQIQAEIQRVAASPKGPLSGYVVGIYFVSSEPASVKSANAIRAHLLAQGLGATVRLYPSTTEFMESVVSPVDLQVRYEEGIEDRQAKVLADALAKAPFARTPRLQLVVNTSRNFLAVFVPNGG